MIFLTKTIIQDTNTKLWRQMLYDYKEANMDTTTLIFVIIGAFTVSSWFMRLVDYLEGGNKRV